MHQGRQHHEGGRCDVGVLREALPVILFQKNRPWLWTAVLPILKPRHAGPNYWCTIIININITRGDPCRLGRFIWPFVCINMLQVVARSLPTSKARAKLSCRPWLESKKNRERAKPFSTQPAQKK